MGSIANAVDTATVAQADSLNIEIGEITGVSTEDLQDARIQGGIPVLIYVEIKRAEHVTRYEVGGVGCFAVVVLLMEIIMFHQLASMREYVVIF